MELVEVIVRLIYLIVLYVALYVLLNYNTTLAGNALIMISFFGAVLILYITFNSVYDFLMNNEIILQIKGASETGNESNNDDDEETDESQSENVTSNANYSNTETNISNEVNEVNTSILNHTHQFIADNVFN